MAITYTRNRKTTQQEMLDTAKNYLTLLKWIQIKLLNEIKKISGYKYILKESKTINEERTVIVREW